MELKKIKVKVEPSVMARSEAKRLLFGLEEFNLVIIDFKDTNFIGPSFSDEIFRVWQNKHPKIILKPINTIKTVEMMINRAKDTNI